MSKTVNDIKQSVDTSILMSRPLPEWRPLLADECQVYVIGENYLAKRFDQINYQFCSKQTAKEILVDNLYALLRFKYFKESTEKIDDRIDAIVDSFSINLKTTLKKVSFDYDTDAELIKLIPSTCVAFRNGVFDFFHNKWLFKYDIIKLSKLNNSIYMYDRTYVITWYINLDFNPLDIDITKVPVEDFIEVMKDVTKENKNYCFELMYNMSHDVDNKFSINKFKHLCQIIGYGLLQEFSQHFVFFIGAGQNGKNSLFDGCFTSRVIPRPASNSLDEIENDKFITGALENKAHNIFLESDGKVHTASKMIKDLTGSMYQTIQNKGENKYSSYINCKFFFSANEQDKTKFSDSSKGFTRRVNMIDLYYTWDEYGKYLKKGDYYRTEFSDSFAEIKNDIFNTVIFVYFGMYGILDATKNFTKNFKFSYNDWRMQYTDMDFDLKDKLDALNLKAIVKFIQSSKVRYEEFKPLLFDTRKNRLYMSPSMRALGCDNYDEMLKMLIDDELSSSYFAENDVYINVRLLQKLVGDLTTPSQFTSNFKKIYRLNSLVPIYNNQPYVKCTFSNGRFKVISK